MHTVLNVFLIILTIVVVLLAVLYFVGRRLQKKQAVQQEQMEAAKQTVSMLVIDKKKLKMKEAGLPQVVLDSTPKIMRRTKLPIVKAKVGPRIMTFIADARVFEMIPDEKGGQSHHQRSLHNDVKGVRGTVLEIPESQRGILQAHEEQSYRQGQESRNRFRIQSFRTGSKTDCQQSAGSAETGCRKKYRQCF